MFVGQVGNRAYPTTMLLQIEYDVMIQDQCRLPTLLATALLGRGATHSTSEGHVDRHMSVWNATLLHVWDPTIGLEAAQKGPTCNLCNNHMSCAIQTGEQVQGKTQHVNLIGDACRATTGQI